MPQENSFSLAQIHYAYDKVKSGADFPRFVQDLKDLGVISYDNHVADGLTMYFGTETFALEGEPKYSSLTIQDNSSAEKLRTALSIHQQGETDYPTFCRQAAEAGVEKWSVHLLDMTVTYFDKQGNSLIMETIPPP
jgi:uncharacterized protein YbcV (DUF1398 family)